MILKKTAMCVKIKQKIIFETLMILYYLLQ